MQAQMLKYKVYKTNRLGGKALSNFWNTLYPELKKVWEYEGLLKEGCFVANFIGLDFTLVILWELGIRKRPSVSPLSHDYRALKKANLKPLW